MFMIMLSAILAVTGINLMLVDAKIVNGRIFVTKKSFVTGFYLVLASLALVSMWSFLN